MTHWGERVNKMTEPKTDYTESLLINLHITNTSNNQLFPPELLDIYTQNTKNLTTTFSPRTMSESVAVILLVVLGFFAFNFAVLTFYLYFKLKKAREKSRIKPIIRRENFDTENSHPTCSQPNSSNNSGHLPGHHTTAGHTVLYPTNSSPSHVAQLQHQGSLPHQNHYAGITTHTHSGPLGSILKVNSLKNYGDGPSVQFKSHAAGLPIIPDELINNLDLAMSEGNQAYLEKTIKDTKIIVNQNSNLNSVIGRIFLQIFKIFGSFVKAKLLNSKKFLSHEATFPS